MNEPNSNSLETRYIFYDGYNEFQVQQWLTIRGYHSRSTISGAIYAWHPFLPRFKTVIRIREFVYIDSMSVCCVRAEQLIQDHLDGKTNIMEIPDEEIRKILQKKN